jgi:sugar phosphate isomerase/epimerase
MEKEVTTNSVPAIPVSIVVCLVIGFSAFSQPQTAPQVRHISPELAKRVKDAKYDELKVARFPIAMQCWTFRKFTFFETLEKVKGVGLEYLEAFPGQVLGKEMPGVQFDHNMADEERAKVKDRLKQAGISLVAYGVCDIGKTEESMRKVFGFAQSMGIRTIVTEPADDDFTLLEKLVKEYGISIAIHNHPAPSKYNLPETVFEHIKGRDKRIGACADDGHWMRGMTDPREALKLLVGRIVDFHLKDRTGFGTKDVEDVPWGMGKANIHDILAELSLQDYRGFLTIEYENEKEVDNPIPAIEKSIKYLDQIGSKN